MTTPSKQHTENSPSRLGRRFLCPASRRMERLALEQRKGKGKPLGAQSFPALEGTACHAALARSFIDPGIWKRTLEEHRVPWTAEIHETIQKCSDYLKEEGIGQRYSIEREVPIVIRNAEGKVIDGGTADLVGRPRVPREPILVLDWKFGRIEPSPIFTACQLAGYAAGVLNDYAEGTTAIAVAFAPRTKTIHRYEFTKEEATTRVLEIIAATEGDDTPFGPGPEACEYCSALAICPAARTVVMRESLRYYGQVLTPTIADEAVPFLRYVEHWVDSVKGWIKEHLESGGEMENAKLVPIKGRRQVVDNVDFVQSIQDVVGLEDLWSLCKFSVSEAQDLYASKWAKATGGTKKEGASHFEASVHGFVERGPDTKRMVFFERDAGGERKPRGRLGEPYHTKEVSDGR